MDNQSQNQPPESLTVAQLASGQHGRTPDASKRATRRFWSMDSREIGGNGNIMNLYERAPTEQFVIDWYLDTLPRTITLVEAKLEYPRKQAVLKRLRDDLTFWQNMNDDPTIEHGNYCSPP